MSKEITVPGISFTLKNNCKSPVRGLLLGNQLYTLNMGTWTAMTPVFDGDLDPGEEVTVFAASDFAGKAELLFVQVSCGAAPVTVSANETVIVPEKYCGCSGDSNLEQLKVG